jgi:para-nitrobenzyl esterase
MIRFQRWFLASVVAAVAGTAIAYADTPPPIVQTASGPVAGTAGDVRAFKGIPFAAPPVGPMRWKPPQPPAPWTTARDATAFGPECVQPGPPGTVMSEDCLTLNVWTAAKPGEHLPVMVWIYGGGYAVGSASQPTFDGAVLAKHGVVVVTFNYRLNVFGFLAHPQLTAESPEHTSGNYGILDQMAAFRWVQNNIAAFGGDPKLITAFGDSAGAGSVSAMLIAPRGKGLFVHAIMESPPVLRPMLTLAQAEAAGTALAAGADLAALRALPAADLLHRIPALDPDTRSNLPITFGPIADNVVLPDERTAYATRAVTVMPLMIGNNANEGGFFARGVPVKSLDQYHAALEKRFGAAADQAAVLWPATDDAGANAAEATIVGDLDINTGARRLAGIMANLGAPVYRYLFTRARGGKAPVHSDDVAFVFGASGYNGVGMPAAPFDATDAAVSEMMMRSWTQFAKSGNPNAPGNATWPRYASPADQFIVFGDTPSIGTGFRTAQLDFLAKTVGR